MPFSALSVLIPALFCVVLAGVFDFPQLSYEWIFILKVYLLTEELAVGNQEEGES